MTKLMSIVLEIIGATTAVISTIIAVLDFFGPTWTQGTELEKGRVTVAKIIAPHGYQVLPEQLEVIRENSTFARSPGESAVLTKSKRVPFTVYQVGHKGVVGVYINGKRDTIRVGLSRAVPETNCTIWLFDIKHHNGPYSFELRC